MNLKKHNTTDESSNVVKPVGALSHTNWLTDAVDAEPGMELVIATGTDTERFEIVEVGLNRLRLADGSSVPIQKVNAKPTMVVE